MVVPGVHGDISGVQ